MTMSGSRQLLEEPNHIGMRGIRRPCRYGTTWLKNPVHVEASKYVDSGVDGDSVHVEASKYVDSGVLPHQATEVDTARFFFQTTLSRKIEKNCLSGHVIKQKRRDLQLLHKDQA
ncbi:hypothetical protein MTR_6g061800 [Medicago truncatula]|uniref:Uncharacterized protein n=1 Tax=Medicago truncatula TaxID=3880 RepID=G7KNS6_MEDTR|nr:hypothetical protein MTR_6g061800 [Medicago truncatula]